jgi:NOL1/NOP2/sun family putative RNA methylase
MSKKAKEQSKQGSPQPAQAGLPARFLERMAGLLGKDYPDFEASYAQPPTHGLRVNTLKLTSAQFLTISPYPLTPIPWCPAGFLVSDEERPGKHPYHAAGLYYLQDPSAMAVAEILAPQPGERVLDLAAAPGGKTTHLAALMHNQGLLVANEIKTRRIGHLAANLERWGARHTVITNETPERLAEHFGPFFDRVLVDAPCSGEGMFRKDPAARFDWSEAAILGCAARQTAILHYAARLVRPGGWLCYSTCTFAPEENEAVIARFLEEHTDFGLLENRSNIESFRLKVDFSAFNLQPMPFDPQLTTRFWPHRAPGEGHFVALMQKERQTTAVRQPPASTRRSPFVSAGAPPQARQRYEAFCRQTLGNPPAMDRLTLIGARLYQLPEGLPELSGLRVLHPGWWLGTLKKDRFEPAHALALGLDAGETPYAHTQALPPDSSEVQAYLRGETIPSAGEDGWLIVAIAPSSIRANLAPTDISPLSPFPLFHAFPLGWGKRVQGMVKNHYPRGLLNL